MSKQPTEDVSRADGWNGANDGDSRLGRRGFLVGGAAAGAAALAGCSGLTGGDGGDGGGGGGDGGGGGTPYYQWIPTGIDEPASTATGDGGTSTTDRFVARIDLEALATAAEANPDYGAFSYESLLSSESEQQPPDDPLVSGYTGIILVAFGVGFGASNYPFIGALFRSIPNISTGTPTPTPTPTEGTPKPDVGDTSLDEWIVAGETFIARGSVDTEAVVEAAGDDFSEAGSVGGYTRYEAEAENGTRTFALDDSTVIVAINDDPARLEATVGAKTGDGDRFYDANADAAWAIDQVGTADVLFANPSPDSEEDSGPGSAGSLPEAAQDTSFLTAGLSLGTDAADGTVAMTFDSADSAPAQSDIEGEVGDSADSAEFTVDGTRVSVSGSWSA